MKQLSFCLVNYGQWSVEEMSLRVGSEITADIAYVKPDAATNVCIDHTFARKGMVTVHIVLVKFR